jgi:glucose/galactose transporter
MPASISGSKNYYYQLCIIGLFFFIFGFITWANGTLIPYLKIACNLQHQWQAYLVTFAFYISYTVMAIPCGIILKKTGMIKGMQLGLFIMALGCILFVPAANSRAYELFLLGLFVIGTGLTILQTAVNPYVTILGPLESAAQRISIMGICSKSAGALAPIILGVIILQNSNDLTEELKVLSGEARNLKLNGLAQKVIMPYSLMAIALFIISLLIRFAHLPEVKSEEKEIQVNSSLQKNILAYPNLILGFVAIFCSVAAEVIAGDTIGNYGLFQGYALDDAKIFTSITLVSMIIGYFIGVFAVPRLLSQSRAFFIFNIIGVALTLMVILIPGKISVWFLGFLGLANALLWPAIWPAALKDLPNRFINMASAILIMGIAGGAILPLAYGVIADHWDLQNAYLILLPCYLFNLFYWKKSMA